MSLFNLIHCSKGCSSIFHCGNSDYFVESKITNSSDYLITIDRLEPDNKTLYLNKFVTLNDKCFRWDGEKDRLLTEEIIGLINHYNEVDILDQLKYEVKGWLKDVCTK